MSRCWKILTLSCRDTAGLVSRDLDDALSGRERLALRLHLLICHACRRYRQHVTTMRLVLRDQAPSPPPTLPEDARRRILAQLDRAGTSTGDDGSVRARACD